MDTALGSTRVTTLAKHTRYNGSRSTTKKYLERLYQGVSGFAWEEEWSCKRLRAALLVLQSLEQWRPGAFVLGRGE